MDLPSEIVAFAHDYAAWIAYQTDHDSLVRLITNPEEQAYAEDDMIDQKKELCSQLKPKLETLLEKAYSSQTFVDDANKDAPSGSRGLGLRWEARSIFLARVVEATDMALSKHDQILLPGSTRLGRTRPLSANITVCVACDRPMRRKVSKIPASSSRPRSHGEMTEAPKAEEDEQHSQNVLDVRPQSSLSCKTSGLSGGDECPRSSSFPTVGIKATCLAESLKENSEPFPNFGINNTL